jgi:hypothetical protein
MRKSMPLLGATALSSLALAACGGGNSDSDKITKVVKDVGKDPSTLCTKYGSAAVIQGIGGKDACLKAAKSATSTDPGVKVANVKVKGNTATADVTNEAGPNKGRTDKVNFVKEGGNWKVAAVGAP